MLSSPFSRLPKAQADPIFTVAAEASAAGPAAINATIGVVLNEEGKPHTFGCVRRAAQEWAQTFATGDFSYPPLLGVPAFRESVTTLVFGQPDEGIASIAAAGGTGALALNLKLLKLMGVRNVILPVPTWPNHTRLLRGFGFTVVEVPFLKDGDTDLKQILSALECEEPSALLLQVCCHNPTGKDLSDAQWKTLADSLAASPHIALLDLAYQGLGRGVEEDAAPVRLFAAAGLPFLLAWSASKNHSVYGLRTGLACAVADPGARKELESHYMILAREIHSAAPTAGQHIVARVQQYHGDAWRTELASLHELLARKRSALASALPGFASSLHGQGMFAVLPLGRETILRLKEQNVFLTEDGRINIAGIPEKRMSELSAILKHGNVLP